jgi:hypothetical protein
VGLWDTWIMKHSPDRRIALFGLGAAAGAAAFGSSPAMAAKASVAWMPQGAASLRALHAKLGAAPRRRDFKTVPMILENDDYWDQEALKELMAYRGSRRQIWDNKDLAGPWLNLMRNNLNTQVYSFKHPDFLIVSATHASAHLALYDQAIWDKYQLSKLAGPTFATNTLIVETDSSDPRNYSGRRLFTTTQFDSRVAAPRGGVLGVPQLDLGTIRCSDPKRLEPRQALTRGAGGGTHQPSRSGCGADTWRCVDAA